MIYENVLELLGGTPVLRVRNVLPDARSRIYVKMEGFNPAGSVKDRAAVHMVEEAERRGELRPGATIIESTSGNFGKALALIGAVKGYRVILVVDPKTTSSVLSYASSLGAEIEVVTEPNSAGSYQEARFDRVRELLAKIPGSYRPDQCNNPDNPRSHALYTAQEIIDDFPQLDALVLAVGTGGHISGTGSALRQHFPRLHVRAVDSFGSAALGFPFAPYRVRGIGNSWVPETLNIEFIDSLHLIEDGEALSMCRVMAAEEGLLLGESGGAVVFAALAYATAHPTQSVLVIAPDRGENYLGESYDDQWLRAEGVEAEDLWRTREEALRHARAPKHPPTSITHAPACASAFDPV
ncbi:cysteine synthase family protein [Streptomyces cinnamoneus]|uniref:PLP-dependent cysteine synthase family protein n=1 Tax=Streptomyces cinnamoneus TaxID=53446 RepID=UPI003402FD6C